MTNASTRSSSSDRYKVKERSSTGGATKLHTLIEDDDPKRAYVDVSPVTVEVEKTKEKENVDDVFSWGSEGAGGGSISVNSNYTAGRVMPPELANPNLHPSPFEDPTKKREFSTSSKI